MFTVMGIIGLMATVVLGGCGGAVGISASPLWSASPTSTMVASPLGLPKPAKVSLGIYSGRPDPAWDLTEAETLEVLDAISVLPQTTGAPPEGGLGYHGFVLSLDRPGVDEETLIAYRGTVAAPGVGPRPYWIDPGRRVERLLLETGRSRLAPIEIAAVEEDLAAAP